MDEKMKEAYRAGMRACGLKAGDKVRVGFIPQRPQTSSGAGGWGVFWNEDMSVLADEVLTVCNILGVTSVVLSNGRAYPWFCLEKVASAPEEKSEVTCSFKQGDLVIVRDADNQLWAGVRFIKYDPSRSCPHLCTPGIWWKHCLPLAGNEHLIGTTDSPSSAPEPVTEQQEERPAKSLTGGDMVLVRDTDGEIWNINIYGYFSPENRFPHRCVPCGYRQCIPYEGNEHLLGTNNNPE